MQRLSLLLLPLIAIGCLRMKVDPIEVKPITLNVNLKVDRELDNFFAFENEAGSPATQPAGPAAPATAPATATTTPSVSPATVPVAANR